MCSCHFVSHMSYVIGHVRRHCPVTLFLILFVFSPDSCRDFSHRNSANGNPIPSRISDGVGALCPIGGIERALFQLLTSPLAQCVHSVQTWVQLYINP